MCEIERFAQDIANHITDLRKIVGFRHLLVHDYSATENKAVWGIVENKVAKLREEVSRLLSHEDGAE